MCSTPKPRQTKQIRTYQNAISADMDQSSYSRMIRQASAAYEKRHPETAMVHRTLKQNKNRLIQSSKSFKHWLTEANLKRLAQLLTKKITID